MVKVEKIVPGGQGIGTLEDGKKAFFWNVLPGEEVEEFVVTKKKSKYIEGIATKIKEKSKYRVEPKDECYLSTSPWQVFDYQFELKTKGEIVRECFSQNGIEIEAPEVVTDGNEWGYRNKMEYALYWDKEKEKIELAFHQRGTHRKVPIMQSSIERPEIFSRAREIVSELNRKREEARKYQSLLLRSSQVGEVSGGLYENHKAHSQFPSLSDEIFGISYTYSPNGFFQINLPIYQMALSEISRAVSDSSKVLDLYSGVGTIGLSVFQGKELTLIECDKSAYRELEKNCKTIILHHSPNDISSERVFARPVNSTTYFTQSSQKPFGKHRPRFCSDEENVSRIKGLKTSSEKIVREMAETSSTFNSKVLRDDQKKLEGRTEKSTYRNNIHPVLAKSEEALDYIEPDMAVILDPPRAGCHQKLLERLLEVLPEKIVYLSCNPITQARDVAILREKYQISQIKAFNFFPKTPHIENLVLLKIKSPPEREASEN